MLKITDITIQKLKDNKFMNELPEFYELKDVHEKSFWHDSSVFDHTIDVLENLEKILKNVKDKISKYLEQKITNHTREDLLFLSTLFHDIAKKETIIKGEERDFCPKHEEMGAIKVKKILERFDLTEKEKNFVIKMIKYHDVVHLIPGPGNKNIDKEFEEFKIKYPDMFLEMVLMAMADTLGCELKDIIPDEFEFRMKFYNRVVEEY